MSISDPNVLATLIGKYILVAVLFILGAALITILIFLFSDMVRFFIDEWKEK